MDVYIVHCAVFPTLSGAVKNVVISRILIIQSCPLLRNEHREKAVPIPGADSFAGAAYLYSDLIKTSISQHLVVFTCAQVLQVDTIHFCNLMVLCVMSVWQIAS